MNRALFVVLFVIGPAFAADPPDQPPPAPQPAPQPAPESVNPPVLALPPSKSGPVKFPIVITPIKNTGAAVRWMLPDAGLEEFMVSDLFSPEDAKKMVGRTFYSETPGKYRVWAVSAKNGLVSQVSQCVVEVTGPPVPPGPVPPGPTPPVPPGPTPIPGDGLRVLIVYETADLPKYPKEQLSAIYSADVYNYLNTHCAKGPDGKTPEWRIWDQNVPTGAESKTWQDAMARKRDRLPWLVISTGKTGFEGPLPATKDEVLKVIKQYGGN